MFPKHRCASRQCAKPAGQYSGGPRRPVCLPRRPIRGEPRRIRRRWASAVSSDATRRISFQSLAHHAADDPRHEADTDVRGFTKAALPHVER